MSKEFRELIVTYFGLPINIDSLALFKPDVDLNSGHDNENAIWIDSENVSSTMVQNQDNIQTIRDSNNQQVLMNVLSQHKETKVVLLTSNASLVKSFTNNLANHDFWPAEEQKKFDPTHKDSGNAFERSKK